MAKSSSELSLRGDLCGRSIYGAEPGRGFAEEQTGMPGPGIYVVRGLSLVQGRAAPKGRAAEKGQPGMRQAKKWVY